MYFTTATATAAFAAGLTLLSSASAVKVLSPGDDTIWASGTSSQSITWEAVSTDPESFQVQLVNQVRVQSAGIADASRGAWGGIEGTAGGKRSPVSTPGLGVQITGAEETEAAQMVC